MDIARHQNVSVIALDTAYEALDQAKFDAAQSMLLEHAETVEPALVVLDLSKTAYLGSAFIEVIFRAWKRVKAREGKLVLCGVQPLCAEVLRTTRLDSVVACFADVEAAVRGVQIA